MTRPTFKRQAFAPEPFTIALGSDPHWRQNLRQEHWLTARERIAERGCDLTIVGGDLDQGDLLSWNIVPVPGNWDTRQLPSDDGTPCDGDPFGDLRALYPQHFGSRDWYALDVRGRLRILVCQNNSPSEYAGADAYWNCNPASPLDYSGWTDPFSEQRTWLDQRVAEWSGEHVLLCTHRPAWAPHADPIRPLHPCRDAWRVPVQRSIGKTFVAAGGDIHVGSHCRITEFGCAFDAITASGAYVERAVVDGVVPYLWASGRGNPPRYKVHIHFLTYFATWAQLEVLEISDDDPSGSIVHQAKIEPVTGGES